VTYAQEKAEKARAKALRSPIYLYEPVLFDRMNAGYAKAYEGFHVVKVQPHGCPRNGYMGMCYIGDPQTGAFIGMVCLNSLKKVAR
jgi:hypothetical protein